MINCLKGSIHVLMSVLICKIQCSFNLFLQALFSHIGGKFAEVGEYLSHLFETLVSATNDDDYEEVVNHVDGHSYDVTREEEDAKEDEVQIFGDTLILKSSLRKAVSNSTEAEKKEKKKVQWLDVMGKELAEIREFETSEEDDLNSDRGKTCVCVIL